MVFGLAGALPYLGTSGLTIYLANQAGEAASGATTRIDPSIAVSLLDQALSVQVTYGAVMLGFLGALHWGMEFAGYGGYKGSKRLMLGIAPVIVGWGTLALDPSMALITQWAGFTGLWYADMKATSAGWSKLSLINIDEPGSIFYKHRNGTPSTASICPFWSGAVSSEHSLVPHIWALRNPTPQLLGSCICSVNSAKGDPGLNARDLSSPARSVGLMVSRREQMHMFW
jgi:hypothetical protein